MRLQAVLPELREDAGYQALYQRLRSSDSPGPARFSVLDAAKPALIAALHGQLRLPTLLLVSRQARARQLVEELRAWSDDPEAVYLFRELDALPYERMLPGPEQLSQRLRAMLALATTREGAPPLVVITVRAAMDRLMAPQDCRATMWRLATGQTVGIEPLIADWVRAGYEPVPVVAGPGEFARRGGIVDICPFTTRAAAFRIELEGNRVESLRNFDLATQRSTGLWDEIIIGPAHEVRAILPEGAAEALEQLALARLTPRVQEQLAEEVRMLLEGQAFPLLDCYRGLLGPASILDYLSGEGLLIMDEPGNLGATARELHRQAEVLSVDLLERGEAPGRMPRPYRTWDELSDRWVRPDLRRLDFVLDADALDTAFAPAPSYSGRLPDLVEAVVEVQGERAKGARVVVVSQQAARLQELFAEQGVQVEAAEAVERAPMDGLPAVALVHGALGEGWGNASVGLLLLTDREVFGWTKVRRGDRERAWVSTEALLSALETGGLVVHVDHGIGRYRGLIRLTDTTGTEREYLDIEYADRARLRVSVEHADRVRPYVSAGEAVATLTRLGSGDWQRTKRKIRSAVQRIARELVELYARRELAQGIPLGSDTQWLMELEASFPYEETVDQLQAVRDVKDDLERSRPMDRLIVGDAGYGKTEVALRAAFKAVVEGKQVAVLVPTTVLAQQHFQTFRERLAPFPVRVEVLSRFLTDRQAREVVEGIRAGHVDIVIGTHRLLQADVAFRDLGLLIIDEEQRFGVVHKERFKQLRTEVHVLTLSATPIPRTLHLSLVGVRDLSMIQTPPEERLPVRTYVMEHEESLIREAILRELDRGGQVFYVANRVYSIHSVAARLQGLVPEARISVAHGQMPDDELELAMLEFVNGQTDVLVCTTIIEAGLDLPNVNTIVVTNAQLFGLAQLYQLRGRVGRGGVRAYAYFLYPPDRQLTEVAEKRLRAIFEASELSVGYQIALKDLEIRGAGNLLGVEQHGHIAAVGFDLYCRLLGEAVEQLKQLHQAALEVDELGERVLSGAGFEEDQPLPSVSIPLSAFLPADYVREDHLRVGLYQRLASVRDEQGLDELVSEVGDRFGRPPEPAQNLFMLLHLRLAASEAGVAEIGVDEGEVVVRLSRGRLLDGSALSRALGVSVRVRANQARMPLLPASRLLSPLRALVEQLREQASDLATARA